MLIVKKFGGSSVANKEYSMWQNAALKITGPDMTWWLYFLQWEILQMN